MNEQHGASHASGAPFRHWRHVSPMRPPGQEGDSPQLGPTTGWRKGADITDPDDPNLQPGTATDYGFNPDGKGAR